MTDLKITAAPAAARPQPKQAPKTEATAEAAPQAAMAADRIQTQASPAAEGIAAIREALRFPDRPRKGADAKPWLMDAYSRLLKAEAALDAVERASGADRVDFKITSGLRTQITNARYDVEQLDKDGAVKAEFFQGVIPPAQQVIAALNDFPKPPADKQAKAEWLVEAKQAATQAQAASQLLKSAWFDFNVLDFKDQADATTTLFMFESRIRGVEIELSPPRPKTDATAKKGTSAAPAGDLFALTQGASDLANSKNPVGQVAGAVALPIAVTIDMIDLLTRPLRWLDSLSQEKP
jgi:hypothetical protein